MTKLNSLSKILAAVACIATSSVSNAQETETIRETAVHAVALQEDGSLTGNAFVLETTEKAANAKITLTQDGQVVNSVNADEEGNFSFQNVEPGSYGLLGAADPYVGQSSYEVAPFSTGGCSSCSVGLSSPSAETVYDSYAAAPAQAFNASPCGCNGGGGGGRIGGGGGLGGGRGLLGSRRLLRLGAIGGIVAIAVSDDDDDASPDN